MAKTSANEFRYGGGTVEPGEQTHFRHTIGETYLGDPIRVPVTIINGADPGPALVLVAALHGDELNGVETVRHVADEWNHATLQGTLVCLHVVNVPGFNAQERYLPLDDSDLNRSFPGSIAVLPPNGSPTQSTKPSFVTVTSESIFTPQLEDGRTSYTCGAICGTIVWIDSLERSIQR